MAAAVVRFVSCLAHRASDSSMMAAAHSDGVAMSGIGPAGQFRGNLQEVKCWRRVVVYAGQTS